MKRKPRNFVHYKGCIIERNTSPGYALRWSSLTDNGKVSADTLQGCKNLITESIKTTKTTR